MTTDSGPHVSRPRGRGSCGAVVEPIAHERSALFGACFAFGRPDIFVTAAHVVTAGRDRGAQALHVIGPGVDLTFVETVRCHPEQDLAVLFAPGAEADPFRAVLDPEPSVRAHLAAWRGGRREECSTTVCGEAVQVAPPECAYRFEAFALADAPGRAFSGAAVVSDGGGVFGVLTHTARRHGLEWGVALRLASAFDWLEQVLDDIERSVPA